MARFRVLAEDQPAVYAGNLAVALLNLGVGLGQVGRPVEALPHWEEAVARFRVLAEDQPAMYAGNLAVALMNLGGGLGEVGRPARRCPTGKRRWPGSGCWPKTSPPCTPETSQWLC